MLRGREFGDQVQTFSCLWVLHNAVVAWNMFQIEDIVNQLRAEGNKIDGETLSHVTPLIRASCFFRFVLAGIVTRYIILGVCSLSMRYVDASYFYNTSTSIRGRRSWSIPVRASSRSVLRRDR